MNVEFQLWQLITLILTIVGAFYGLAKLLFAQFERRMDEKHAALGQRLDVLTEENKGWQRVDRDLLSLRLELAERYVKRDDYIRGQTVIEAKLDAISSELRNVQIRQGAT
jgi:hypothetical protein